MATRACPAHPPAAALHPTNPGAGKTYTMTGDRSSYQQRGLIPRTVSALMAALRSEPGLASWQLRVSYLEVNVAGC